MNSSISCRLTAAGKSLVAVFFVLLASAWANGQALSVLPVNVFFTPGQRATSLTVNNMGATETAIQIRAYAWSQKDGEDQLTPSDLVVLSPPLAKIAPGASQVVRLILRQLPENSEATYRILIDQIPPPSEAGVVHVVLRLSIPIFVQPSIRSFSDVQFHLERDAGQIYLDATNKGNLHDTVRDIELSTSDGHKLKPESGGSPYLLPGASRRWRIAAQDSLPSQSETLQLTAHLTAGAIDQQVRFVPAR
ncbi:MAG: fimbria/pilus periplasmic chaperone [Terracidiphilus sp.]